MFYHNINPVLIEAGPFAVRYYGLIYAFGLLFSFLIIRHLARKRQLPLASRDFDELLLLGTAGVVIGARKEQTGLSAEMIAVRADHGRLVTYTRDDSYDVDQGPKGLRAVPGEAGLNACCGGLRSKRAVQLLLDLAQRVSLRGEDRLGLCRADPTTR